MEGIGRREAQIVLSQADLYGETAPNSNAACNAVFSAAESVRRRERTVPAHLQDGHYKGSKSLGRGTGYKYAHDYPKHYVRQQYLPEEIADARFYEPGDNGYEKKIKAWMEYIRE